MRLGDAVTMRAVKDRRERPDGKLASEFTYRSPKGKLFVFLLVGLVDSGKEGELDPNAILRDLGWTLSNDDSADVGSSRGGER